MALMREMRFAQQAIQNLGGLRRDMRRNARGYKTKLLDNFSRAKVLNDAVKDAAAYLIRIQWMADINNNPSRKARLKTGIEALGVTNAAEIKVDYVELRDAANNLALTTLTDIEVRADQLLADVRKNDSVWEE